jgi:hypothetical protein
MRSNRQKDHETEIATQGKVFVNGIRKDHGGAAGEQPPAHSNGSESASVLFLSSDLSPQLCNQRIELLAIALSQLRQPFVCS